MGHQDKVVKLGRHKPHREAMLSNMAMSLFEHRTIKTTEAKAKALRPLVDRLITTAKKDTVASRRQVAKTIHVKEVYQKLYNEILPQFSERNSGFCRVVKLGVRKGDGAPLSVVELLTEKPKEETDSKGKKAKKTTKAKASTSKTAKTSHKEDKPAKTMAKSSTTTTKKTTPSTKNK